MSIIGNRLGRFMKGFQFGDKHSFEDFDLLMDNYTVKTPPKNTILVEIPFRNGTLDFAPMLGENIYQDRVIDVTLSYKAKNKGLLKVKYNRVVKWLLDDNIGKTPLVFDDEIGYHYLAYISDSIDVEETALGFILKISFNASPFRVGNNYEGNRLEWDIFNFEEDMFQDTIFNDIKGFKQVKIYNIGKRVTPVFKIVGRLSIKQGDYISPEYDTGEVKDFLINLKSGENTLTFTGTGSVEVLFRKEML